MFVAEIATVGVLVGVVMAVYRRMVMKPAFLHTAADAYLILVMIAALMLTYFLSEAFRFSVEGVTDAWYAPVSLMLSGLASGIPVDLATNIFGGLWLFHVGIFLAFLMYIPYSKHLHLVAAPVNIFFQNLDAPRYPPAHQRHRAAGALRGRAPGGP